MAGDGPSPAQVAEQVARVRDRIDAAGGSHVRLVAVTKGFGASAVSAAVAAGADACGESYAQELVAKVDELGLQPGAVPPPPARARWQEASAADLPCWHFIGNLQRNKVRHLAPWVSVWQSVDRASLAREIAKRAPGASVLVQLNLSGEPHRGGCDPDDAPALVEEVDGLGLLPIGLMGVAPHGDAGAARAGFRRLVAMADDLGLPERSIGMSGDLEVAVGEGATIVRVGSDLFGPRPVRRSGEGASGPGGGRG